MEKEYQKINRAIDIFSEYAAKRMLAKADDGWTGWTEPEHYHIRDRLLLKATKISIGNFEEKDLLDVSNFAMMLFMSGYNKSFPETRQTESDIRR